jgi:hypothetical protein
VSIQPLIGRPGIGTARTASYRNVMRGRANVRHFPGGGTIDGASRDGGNTDNLLLLRPGLPMGRVTASKRWRPSIIGPVVTTALTSTATTLKLSVAQAAELLRRVGRQRHLQAHRPADRGGYRPDADRHLLGGHTSDRRRSPSPRRASTRCRR